MADLERYIDFKRTETDYDLRSFVGLLVPEDPGTKDQFCLTCLDQLTSHLILMVWYRLNVY